MLKINLIKLHKSWFKEVPNTRKQKKKNIKGCIRNPKIRRSFTLACNGSVQELGL